jgi:hypothetical protein
VFAVNKRTVLARAAAELEAAQSVVRESEALLEDIRRELAPILGEQVLAGVQPQHDQDSSDTGGGR